MNRIFCTVLLCVAATNVYAQLPNSAGQIWQEYPASISWQPAEFDGASPAPFVFGPEVVTRMPRDDAEQWGEHFGLINCDDNKIYVYHTPQMQRKVNELVGRFVKPEFRGVEFTAEARFFSISDKQMKSDAIPDLRAEFFELLHPIVTEGKQPISKTPGVHAYWIAKEDLPNYEAACGKMMGIASSHVDSNVLQAPKVTTFNGCRGQVQDVSQQPFVTDVIPFVGDSGTAYNPIISIVEEGTKLEVFSLLSFDGKTVTTDFSAAFTKIEKVGMAKVVEIETEENSKKLAGGVTLQVPFQRKTEFAVNDITWPADGILLLFVTGIEQLTESRTEAGVPILNKIPYVNRRFTNSTILRKTQTLNVVVTVKMINEK